MVHRLFVADPLGVDASLTLDRDASHYLARVLRLAAGQPIELFNGDGNHYEADIVDAEKTAVTVTVRRLRSGLIRTPRLHLSVALLKGDKLDFALQKATELDVDKVWLTPTARCELRLSDKRKVNRLNHWQKIMRSASEQCGRTTLPNLVLADSLFEVVEATHGMQRYCLHPDAPTGELSVGNEDLCLFTGPEGGFDATEMALLEKHGQAVGLGELVLRAETAPLVGLALAGAARRARSDRGASTPQ